MNKEEHAELGKTLVGKMRESFARGDWDGTAGTFVRFAEIKPARAVRLEATCLAARALAAAKQRSAARHLLKTVASGDHRKPVHYEFLALAHLDLKQYKQAAGACEKADSLRAEEHGRRLSEARGARSRPVAVERKAPQNRHDIAT